MHKHPTPVTIKLHVLKAMMHKFDSMTYDQVSAMMDALDEGVRIACEKHDKIWGDFINDQ